MAMYVEEQLRKVIDSCECFCFQFDETTDMADVAQLCFPQDIFVDMNAKEELPNNLSL